jgi:serine/threonine protein kinase
MKALHLLNNPQSKANDVLKQDNKNIESKYKKIKVLKEGGFGKAFLCSKVGDQALCVIKEMKTKSLTEREINEMKREAEILKVLKHPNVIRLREFYMNSRNKFCIVMDYAEKGDLASKLDKTENFFSENQILEWFVQLCLALKHIHDRKIVHRDLKSQNVFLTAMNTIKLGDFGISKILKNTHQLLSSFVGTWYYISPEIIRGKLYSFKTDIWSLGVILYEMCALKLPFRGKDQFILQKKIKDGTYQPLSSKYSPELRSLVDSLLKVDQHKRPSISQVLAFPIIKRRISKFLNEMEYFTEFSHTVIHGLNVLKDNDKKVIDKLIEKNGNKLLPPHPIPLHPNPNPSPCPIANNGLDQVIVGKNDGLG